MKNNVDSEYDRIIIDTEIFDDRSQDRAKEWSNGRSGGRSDSEKVVPQARGAQKLILPTVQGTTTFTTWTTWTTKTKTIGGTKISSKALEHILTEPLPNYFRENHQWDIRIRFGNSDFLCERRWTRSFLGLTVVSIRWHGFNEIVDPKPRDSHYRTRTRIRTSVSGEI